MLYSEPLKIPNSTRLMFKLDHVIVFWFLQDSCLQCLEGHAAPVRGLQWNPELTNLLMSGSWDHKIKLWNVRYYIYYDFYNKR